MKPIITFILALALIPALGCDVDDAATEFRETPCDGPDHTEQLEFRVLGPDGGWVTAEEFGCNCLDYNTGEWFLASCPYSPDQMCAVCCGKAGAPPPTGQSEPTDPDPE